MGLVGAAGGAVGAVGGHVLVGSLPFSGRFRAVFAEAEDQPHLTWAMHQVWNGWAARRGGGGSTGWPR